MTWRPRSGPRFQTTPRHPSPLPLLSLPDRISPPLFLQSSVLTPPSIPPIYSPPAPLPPSARPAPRRADSVQRRAVPHGGVAVRASSDVHRAADALRRHVRRVPHGRVRGCQGGGSRVKSQGLRVKGQGSRVKGQGSRVKGQGSRVEGQGFSVWGEGSRV